MLRARYQALTLNTAFVVPLRRPEHRPTCAVALRRLRGCTPAAAGQGSPGLWDVIEYFEPPPKQGSAAGIAAAGAEQRVRLGLVADTTQGGALLVEPLVVAEQQDGQEGVWWTHDESAVLDGPQAVGPELVLRVVDADYSQVWARPAPVMGGT
jgi:hypothetical protein